MAIEVNRYKKGWRLLLIKAAGTIAVVFLFEKILALWANHELLGASLLPFHHHYFSFSSYYLTSPGLGSDFSDDPSATTRFIIFFVLGYLVYAVINIVIWVIPVLKKRADRINSVLFYLLVLGVFVLAFFLPRKMTVIDKANKEIVVSRYSYLFIPATLHVPFDNISNIGYDVITDYDGYNKKYINYLVISLTTKSGAKISLGEIQAGEQKGTLTHKPAVIVSPEKSAIITSAVRLLNDAIR